MAARKTRNKSTYSLCSNVGYIIRNIWRDCRPLLIYILLAALCGAFAPFFGIYLPKLMVDLIEAKASAAQMLSRVGGFSLLMGLFYMVYRFAQSCQYPFYNGNRMEYMYRLFFRKLECDYQITESAEGQTRYQKAHAAISHGDWSGVSQMTSAISSLSVSILSFLLYSTVLSTLSPLIVLLLIAATLIDYFTLRHAREYQQRNKDNWAKLDKKIQYMDQMTRDFSSGKDIRLYGMRPTIMALWLELLDGRLSWEKKTTLRALISQLVNAATILLRDGLAYLYLIHMTVSGALSVGDFLLYFGAIASFGGFISSIIRDLSKLSMGSLQISDLRAFMDIGDRPEPEHPQTPDLFTGAPEIEFRDVTFGYGDGTRVLDGFSLKIAPGERISLVGVNGAGKTTLIKLLCGFYQPNRGQVRIGGIDIRNMRKEDLYALLSVVFQDFPIYPYTVAENITLREDDESDSARIWDCLKMVGLRDHVMNLPEKLKSPMHKENKKEGVVFSGGQQQKLVMARALYKDGPILLLDEPSAALDPIAESEIYRQYDELTRGKTSIYISHRLASAKFCDRVVFLENGRAAEVGTHDELMAKRSGYASMYEIQSHYYQKEGDRRAAIS